MDHACAARASGVGTTAVPADSPAHAGTHSAVHGPGRCGGVAPAPRSMTPASRSVIVGGVVSVGWVMASPLTALRSSWRGVTLHRRVPNTAARYLSPGP